MRLCIDVCMTTSHCCRGPWCCRPGSEAAWARYFGQPCSDGRGGLNTAETEKTSPDIPSKQIVQS